MRKAPSHVSNLIRDPQGGVCCDLIWPTITHTQRNAYQRTRDGRFAIRADADNAGSSTLPGGHLVIGP